MIGKLDTPDSSRGQTLDLLELDSDLWKRLVLPADSLPAFSQPDRQRFLWFRRVLVLSQDPERCPSFFEGQLFVVLVVDQARLAQTIKVVLVDGYPALNFSPTVSNE